MPQTTRIKPIPVVITTKESPLEVAKLSRSCTIARFAKQKYANFRAELFLFNTDTQHGWY